MAEIQPVSRKSIKSGLITVSAVAANNYPPDALQESLNFNFDTIGKITLRKGLTTIGNALASSNMLGLYQFINRNGSTNQLIAVNGTTAYYLDSGGTWTAKRTGLTTGKKARFTTMLNYVFMVNGHDATKVWDGGTGTSFLDTGNASGAPIGKYVENYRARIWIAGNTTYPDRVYFSSLPAAVSTPVVTWNIDPATGQWIDISPSDGENITALHRTKGALLVFKNNHLYRIFSILQTDPDPQFNVGTFSQESVVETKNGVYFHHPTGFYRYDGNVTEISRPIIDIVKAITLTNYSKVCGYVEPDGDHICWAVGDVTVNGVAYTNLVVRYTISSQVWTHYSYPYQFLVSASYDDDSTIYTLVGDENGRVFKIETGNTDNGSEIFYSIIHPADDIDGTQSTTKIINTMFFMHDKMDGANVSYQIPNDRLNDWTKRVCQLTSSEFGVNNLKIRGREIKFRISGTSKGEQISYEGYEILQGTSQLITYGK